MRVHVVTDSSAHFVHAQVPAQYPLTVVPNRLTIGGQQYLEGNDLTAERALELIAHQPTPPQVVPPTMDDFASVYTRLAYHNDAIISIHASRRLSDSWQHAHEAAAQVAGYIKVYVIDSMTLDAAQGLLVRAALRAVEDLDDDPVTLEAAVEQVRGAAERAYAVYYPETPDYLMRNQLLTPSHAILNRIQGTMPLLSVENGEVVVMEKIRSRGQGVDRLVEFATEFEALEDALILQPRPYANEQTDSLQEQLSDAFPDQHVPHTVYGASLASIIGADATGLAILEK